MSNLRTSETAVRLAQEKFGRIDILVNSAGISFVRITSYNVCYTKLLRIVLSTFVGFTTSIFSASYIAHEVEIGRLTPAYLRFYHAMYQVLMFAMNLARNNFV